jgi:tRNA (guanine37-N1)-methyltransferase
MKTVTLLTLFPEVVTPFLNHSILKQAKTKDRVQFNIVNFRQFSLDNHQTVDDHPYGGGAGMLLMIDPLVRAIEAAEFQYGPAYKLLLTPQGKTWTQAQAKEVVLAQKHILLICGHYEGVDERLLDYVDAEVSIGQFVLSGGEAAALVIIDTLIRLIPGVLKKDKATSEETFMTLPKSELYEVTQDPLVLAQKEAEVMLFEYPQYTRPEQYRGKKVPQVLLSGDHQKIKKWRLQQAWEKTKRKLRN